MIPAPCPTNEAERLEALRQCEVLDTLPEASFDRLTSLAAHLCSAPIALISLVDENRQWFKSRVGLTAEETARDVSFCGHAIMGEDLMVIPDALEDERFADNPLVAGEPNIRFYAGAPLRTHDGYALGTLCVIDQQPHELPADQARALRTLARHTASQLELRRFQMQMREAVEALEGTCADLRREREELAQSLWSRTETLGKLYSRIKEAVADRDRAEAALQDVEHRFHEVERERAATRLVHEIAHDVQNTFAVILAQSEALRDELGNGHPQNGAADKIVDAAHRGALLLRQALSLAKTRTP